MHLPKISIITAVYNNKDTIEDSIKSILSQEYPNIEYIVINGNSNDGTHEIINSYSDRIDKYIYEKDNGIYDALNKGISHATGDIVGFLHSDDIFLNEGTLREVANEFINKDVDSVYGDLVYVSKTDPNKIIRTWKSGEFSPSSLRYGWMLPHPTLFVKRAVYYSSGLFDTSLKISADYDLIIRLFKKHKISYKYIPHTIVRMRIGGESNKSLSNIFSKTKEDLIIVKKNNIGGLLTVFLKNIRKIHQFFI